MSRSVVPGFTKRLSEIGRSTSRWISSSLLEDQRVERDRHRTLDGVLDRDHTELVIAALDRRDHVGDRGKRGSLTGREIGLAQQRFLGERAGRSEERDRGHDEPF